MKRTEANGFFIDLFSHIRYFYLKYKKPKKYSYSPGKYNFAETFTEDSR